MKKPRLHWLQAIVICAIMLVVAGKLNRSFALTYFPSNYSHMIAATLGPSPPEKDQRSREEGGAVFFIIVVGGLLMVICFYQARRD